jgi:tRNA threonylcarbamoyl adenosine modification protein YeaZ
MNKPAEQFVLAIETATEPGSVSILRENSPEIDFQIGRNGVSQSGDLLPSISGLLRKNQIPAPKIKLIAVSRGPGSFTGIRVGAATAFGLAFGKKGMCVGVSTLEALAAAASENSGKIRSVVAGGRGMVFYQDFTIGENRLTVAIGEIQAAGLEDMIRSTRLSNLDAVVLDGKINPMHDLETSAVKVIVQPSNLARYVGLIAINNLKNGISEELEPFYGREIEASVKQA